MPEAAMYKVGANLGAGDSTVVDLDSNEHVKLQVFTKVNGGTPTLVRKVSPDGGTTWVDLDNPAISITGNQQQPVVELIGTHLKCTIAGTTPDVDVWFGISKL